MLFPPEPAAGPDVPARPAAAGHHGRVPTQPTDDELELIRQSGVVLRVGRLSLSAGTGSYRVKESMARVARALGIERHQAHVTLTEITTTSHRGPSFRTEVAEVRAIGIDAARLSALEDMASRLEGSGRTATVEEVAAGLDSIEQAGPLYPPVLHALWAAIACSAFAFLTGGGPVEMMAVFVGAGVGQLVRRAMATRRYNQFGVTMIAAAVGCLTYVGFVDGLGLLGVAGAQHEAGYVASVLFLVPGFPLITGTLDLVKLDFSAGVDRLAYATMVVVSAGLAVWAVSTVVGLSPDALTPLVLDPGALLVLRLVASFFGVLGFALMFNSPVRMALAAAGVGMVANTLRLELADAGMAAQAAAALGAALVGLLAAWVAPRLRVPRITISVPAVVIMVPGVLAYRAVFHLSNGDMTQALANGTQAVLVVAAIAIGLAVGRMLTDRTWAFES